MKRKILLLSTFLLFLTACGQPTHIVQRFSYIEVVDRAEDASLSHINDLDLIMKESEVIVGLEKASEKYPRYNFEKAPAYVIFEYTGYLTDDMILFTYDKDEAVALIEEKIQDEKEKEE